MFSPDYLDNIRMFEAELGIWEDCYSRPCDKVSQSYYQEMKSPITSKEDRKPWYKLSFDPKTKEVKRIFYDSETNSFKE